MIIGTYTDHALICLDHDEQGEPAEAQALPDGFTCDECGRVVMP